MKTGHTHQLEETDRFHRYGFAAGVGACDDDHVVVLTDCQIDGNDLLGIDQWMPTTVDADHMILVEGRADRFLLHGELRPGENKVQLRHIRAVVPQRHQMIGQQCGQRCQNLVLFLFLLKFQFADMVAHLHDGGRLDEQGRAGGGLVMHDAANLCLVFALDRQAIAVVTHGYHRILQIGGIGLGQHLVQLDMDPVIGLTNLPAQLLQLRARIIGDLVFRQNAASDL